MFGSVDDAEVGDVSDVEPPRYSQPFGDFCEATVLHPAYSHPEEVAVGRNYFALPFPERFVPFF